MDCKIARLRHVHGGTNDARILIVFSVHSCVAVAKQTGTQLDKYSSWWTSLFHCFKSGPPQPHRLAGLLGILRRGATAPRPLAKQGRALPGRSWWEVVLGRSGDRNAGGFGRPQQLRPLDPLIVPYSLLQGIPFCSHLMSSIFERLL